MTTAFGLHPRCSLGGLSCLPEARGLFVMNRAMLSHTLIIVHRESTLVVTTDHPRERKSTQRELNPHLRLGETVRCRYVMGA